MGVIHSFFVLCLVLSPFVFADDTCQATYGSGPQTIRLATGSPGELGLVDVLADAFNKTRASQQASRS